MSIESQRKLLENYCNQWFGKDGPHSSKTTTRVNGHQLVQSYNYLYFLFTTLLIQSCLHEFDIVCTVYTVTNQSLDWIHKFAQFQDKLLNLEIAQFHYTIRRTCKVLAQLLHIIRIPKMSCTIPGLHKFLDCAEHVYGNFSHYEHWCASWCWHSPNSTHNFKTKVPQWIQPGEL